MLDLRKMRDDARKVLATAEQFCQDHIEVYSECDEGMHQDDPRRTAVMESYQRFSHAAMLMQSGLEILEAAEQKQPADV